MLAQYIIAIVEAAGDVVINVASIGHAALQLPHRATAHSVFAIPVDDAPELFSNLSVRSAAALHIARAPIIQWDEWPRVRKAAWESVLSLLDAQKAQHPREYRPKVFIRHGDFRQIPPAIPRASRHVIAQNTVQTSSSRSKFTRFHLSRVWRQAEDVSFCQCIDGIGDGTQPTRSSNAGDLGFVPLRDIATVADEAAAARQAFPHVNDPHHCANAKILAAVNTLMDAHNERILNVLERTYIRPSYHLLSADTLDVDSTGLIEPHLTAEFPTLQNAPGAPPHDLHIVVGGLFELMRNFNPVERLMNHVLVVVKAVHHHHTLKETLDGREYPLPRIVFRWQIANGTSTMARRQYPPRAAYASTFNGGQGRTLARACLNVRRSPFAHGHLYAGVTRVKNRDDMRVPPDFENLNQNGNALVRN
ncbi:unnamed protein product, partial [Prorocentrum cordatum]